MVYGPSLAVSESGALPRLGCLILGPHCPYQAGWLLAYRQTCVLAEQLLHRAAEPGCMVPSQRDVHNDNGTPGETSRHVSNDNPFLTERGLPPPATVCRFRRNCDR